MAYFFDHMVPRLYIYFPLGGSRCEKSKIFRNIFIVWTISGLWHGANWTFVCWGLYHATLLTIYNAIGINTKSSKIVASKHFFQNLKETSQIVLTFFLAVIGWIIFRAENTAQAIGFFSAMINNPFYDSTVLNGRISLGLGIMLLLIEWTQKDKQHALQFPSIKPFNYRLVRWGVYYVILIMIAMFTGESQTFIYFQF